MLLSIKYYDRGVLRYLFVSCMSLCCALAPPGEAIATAAVGTSQDALCRTYKIVKIKCPATVHLLSKVKSHFIADILLVSMRTLNITLCGGTISLGAPETYDKTYSSRTFRVNFGKK